MDENETWDAIWIAYKMLRVDSNNLRYITVDREPYRFPHPESEIGAPLAQLGYRMSDYPKLVAAAKRAGYG